ncbi:hypothetical protein ACLOJK_040994 [Asimina triloba]
MDTLVTHQFREGNQAAEFLAKQGKLGSNEVYEDIQQVLRFLKGVIRIDKHRSARTRDPSAGSLTISCLVDTQAFQKSTSIPDRSYEKDL